MKPGHTYQTYNKVVGESTNNGIIIRTGTRRTYGTHLTAQSNTTHEMFRWNSFEPERRINPK